MDQSRDISGRQLHRLIQTYATPEFVKKASVEEMAGYDGLDADVYADPIHRLFPCHTAAATWTSTAYFLDGRSQIKKAEADMIEARIKNAAKIHGITNLIQGLWKQASEKPVTKEADFHDDDFAVVLTNSDGTKERHYRMTNSMEVKAAADYLLKYRDDMPFMMRHEMANKILDKAAQYGAVLGELEGEIEKQAGHGLCSAGECAEFLLNRVLLTKQGSAMLGEEQGAMLKLAKAVAEKPSSIREPGALVKLAKTVDDFDRFFGIYPSQGAARIEDVLFGISREKVASVAAGHVSTITGNMYKLADLETIRLQDVRDFMGDDFADAVGNGLRIDTEKAAQIIPTLPRCDAEILDRFLDEAGLAPVAKEASAEAVGFSNEYLFKLAQERELARRSVPRTDVAPKIGQVGLPERLL